MISQDISSKNIDMPYIQQLFICLNRFRVQGSEVQRFRGSEVQRFRVQRFRGSGFRGSGFRGSGFRGSEVQKGIKGNGKKR